MSNPLRIQENYNEIRENREKALNKHKNRRNYLRRI